MPDFVAPLAQPASSYPRCPHSERVRLPTGSSAARLRAELEAEREAIDRRFAALEAYEAAVESMLAPHIVEDLLAGGPSQAVGWSGWIGRWRPCGRPIGHANFGPTRFEC
jgi:hypothetical protein